jgi:hypothetical protein
MIVRMNLMRIPLQMMECLVGVIITDMLTLKIEIVIMDDVCNALNLGVEFFLLFSHQIQALPFSFLVPSLNLDLFQSYSGVWLGFPV